jgi:hypothetical protein
MTIQLRMQLHMLVYRIVSLRMAYGNYEDSTSIRSKLEAEIQNRIRRLKEIEDKSELEVAQTLLNLYQEKFQARSLTSQLNPSPHGSEATLVEPSTTHNNC